jgi:hypothetical protein
MTLAAGQKRPFATFPPVGRARVKRGKETGGELMRNAGGRAHTSHAGGFGHYRRLATMAVLSFLAMFALMYAMVDRVSNVLPNLNQAYMAGLMTAPMVLIEVLVMRSMYPNTRLNIAVMSASAAMLVVFWFLIREQTGISDEQFLKSMIPHHGGAILMCEQAPLRDPDIMRLCKTIVSSQQREIDFMKAQLRQKVSN